ncbi:MAG: cobaltochelatase CobT-related protein [Christensenellales bacterium]
MKRHTKNEISTRRLLADARAHVSDEQFFCSPAFTAYLEHMAAIHTSRYSYQYHLTVQMDWLPIPKTHLAYTNNQHIYINAGHPIVSRYTKRNERYLYVLGLFVHELGHVLYTDFPAWALFVQSVLKGQWRPDLSSCSSERVQQSVTEIQAFLDKGPPYRQVIAAVLKHLLNILEDAYIELCLLKKFPGVFGSALMYMRNDDLTQSHTLTEQQNAGLSPWTIAVNLLLYYARFGKLPLGNEPASHPCVQALSPCLETVQNSIVGTFSDRIQAVVMLLVYLWPLANPEKDWARFFSDCQSKQTPSVRTSGLFTEAPIGDTRPVEQIKLSLEDDRKITGTGKIQYDDAYLPHKNNAALNDILDQVAIEQLEKQRAAALNTSVQKMDLGALHNHVDITIHRASVITQDMREKYKRIAAPLLPLSNRLQQELSRELHKRKYPQTMPGYALGKRIDTKRLYRSDQKIFTKNVPAKKGFDMAVAVLLDESGSMGSKDRYKYAQAAAIILQDFCYRLHIPLMVYGHSTSGDLVELYSYVEYDVFADLDRYRLADIQARRSNRDGAALRYVSRRLLERPERNKILILVSDGNPAHTNYWGEAAEDDLRAFRSEFVSCGGLLIAAAIGDDKDAIHRIYGQSFMDITDLSSFPLRLTQYLKRHIRL